MIGHGHGDRALFVPSLHDNVASATPDNLKTMLLKNATDLLTGQNTELTHALLQSA